MAGDISIVTGMAGRYATALFDLAREKSALEIIAGDLKNFQYLLDESEDLTRLVKSPVFTAEDQSKAMSAILDKASISELTAKFIGVLINNRRLFAIRDIMAGFHALLADHNGEVTAEATSASALTDEQMSDLKKTLKDIAGRDVQLEARVDPSLLGGLIVKLGSRQIDNSLKTKLNNLKTRMKEVS